jgi:hypothetical protein
LRASCLRASSQALTRDTPSDAQANAHDAANFFRLHSVYDGSSDPFSAAVWEPSQLLPRRNQSKVEGSYAAPRAHTSGRPPALEVLVTSRLRELIQQLGEAIHESVIESEQIAGVVQDIRKYGFDVLLMLEATIGLNELTAKTNVEGDGTDTESGEDPGTFTQNDLHFLRSLRIAVEGEEDSEAGSGDKQIDK